MQAIGDKNAFFNVYMANQPNYLFSYQQASHAEQTFPLLEGEIVQCGQACGNGWRKVFNVYAKLVFALSQAQLGTNSFSTWQQYRDAKLLQENSKTRLYFKATSIRPLKQNPQQVHLIMGKTYASTLSDAANATWMNNDFAVDKNRALIVCPYFDYRQLSNVKIMLLVELIASLQKPS